MEGKVCPLQPFVPMKYYPGDIAETVGKVTFVRGEGETEHSYLPQGYSKWRIGFDNGSRMNYVTISYVQMETLAVGMSTRELVGKYVKVQQKAFALFAWKIEIIDQEEYNAFLEEVNSDH